MRGGTAEASGLLHEGKFLFQCFDRILNNFKNFNGFVKKSNILTIFFFDSSKYFDRFLKEILDISTNFKKSDGLTDFFIFDL